MNYLLNLPSYPFIIIAALITVLVPLYIYRLKAYRHFRQIIETELKGVWPKTFLLVDEINIKIRGSLKEIEPASIEVRRFISFYRKRAFDTAMENYRNTCKTIDWNDHVTYNMFPSMRKAGDSQSYQADRGGRGKCYNNQKGSMRRIIVDGHSDNFN